MNTSSVLRHIAVLLAAVAAALVPARPAAAGTITQSHTYNTWLTPGSKVFGTFDIQQYLPGKTVQSAVMSTYFVGDTDRHEAPYYVEPSRTWIYPDAFENGVVAAGVTDIMWWYESVHQRASGAPTFRRETLGVSCPPLQACISHVRQGYWGPFRVDMTLEDPILDLLNTGQLNYLAWSDQGSSLQSVELTFTLVDDTPAPSASVPDGGSSLSLILLSTSVLAGTRRRARQP